MSSEKKRVLFRSVASRFLLPVFILLLLLSAVLLWHGYRSTYQSIYDDRTKAIRDMVDFTWGIVDFWGKKAASGEMPLEQAKRVAGDIVSTLRYEGENYIFGYDMENKVAIPFQNHERGKFLDVKDDRGRWLQRDFREIAQTKGKGYYSYPWLNSNTKRVEPKVAYLRAYEPFGWYFGTGVYVDDIRAKVLASILVQAGILGGAILLIGVLLVFITGRVVTRPLRKVALLAARAGEGDLTISREDFCYDGRDEIGSMADSLSSMVAAQADTVRSIAGAVADVSAAADSLSALSEETGASLEEVRKALEDVANMTESGAAASEETNAGIGEVADGARSVAKASGDGAAAAGDAETLVKNTVLEFEDVIANVAQVEAQEKVSMEAVRSLASTVENITGFVVTISRIADQTNLLALNAAIEAARAGEAGRGFAVVADEVRKLAEESNEAAKSIRVLIGGLEEKVGTSVSSAQSSDRILQETVSLSKRSMDDLRQGMGAVRKIITIISDLAAVAEEQSASASEMAHAVDQIASTTSSIAEAAQNIRTSSGETVKASESVSEQAMRLSERAAQLKGEISRFKLSGGGGLVRA